MSLYDTMKSGDVRGLSAIIITVIMIALALVAVGIVWAVISGVISDSFDDVNAGKFMINLDIKKVTIGDGTLDVKVKRNAGEGELKGLKIIVSDGADSEVFQKSTTMGELGEETFTLTYDGLVKSVAVAPVLESESGKEIFGDPVDTLKFSDKEIIENIGGVSWWGMEGNAQDKIGGNNGVINGADCSVDGKVGKACSFDGIDDYIEVADDDSLRLSNAATIEAWIYPTGWGEYNNGRIISKNVWVEYEFRIASGGNLAFDFAVTSHSATGVLSLNKWQHILVTFDGSNVNFYVDGELVGTVAETNHIENNAYSLYIGTWEGASARFFEGKIDELRIYNKALTENQIKGLYNLHK